MDRRGLWPRSTTSCRTSGARCRGRACCENHAARRRSDNLEEHIVREPALRSPSGLQQGPRACSFGVSCCLGSCRCSAPLALTGRSSYEQEIAVLVCYSAHRTIRDSNHIQCSTWLIGTSPSGAP